MAGSFSITIDQIYKLYNPKYLYLDEFELPKKKI